MNYKYIFIFALGFLFILILPLSLFAQGAVVGYADGNKRVNANNLTSFPSNAQLDRLTHVIAVGLGVNLSGTLKKNDLPNFWNGNTNTWLASLVSRAHQRGTKVSISITGESEFNNATSSPQKINAFTNEIVNFVNIHGLDGVEINWEHPIGTVQWNQCISLLVAIRSELPNNKKLSISLRPAHPSQYPNPNPGEHPFPQQIWQISDGIHLMTYDEGGDWPTHSDTTKSNNTIRNWGDWGTTGGRNLCKGELFVGCAFYGYKKDSNGNTIWGDGDKKVSYATYSGGGNYNRGDLPADVQNKAIYTRDNGFGGVFIWELGFDLPADQSNSLLKAIYEVMPYVSGTSTVCNSNTTFTLNNPPPGSTLSWSKSNNLAYVNVVGTGSYTVKAATASTSGNGWVEVTLNSPCGNDTLPRKNVWVGKPSLPTVNPSKGIEMTIADDLLLTLTNTPGASSSSGQWSASGVLYPTYSSFTTGNACFFSADVPGPGQAMVTTSNVCGPSPMKYIYVLVQDNGDGGGPFTISPNPASNEITLIFDEQQSLNSENNTPYYAEMNYSVRIVNNFGLVYFSENMGGNSMRINISNWEKGFYHVFITNNDDSFSSTFIVN